MEKTLYEIMIEEMVARGMRKPDLTDRQQQGDLTWAVFNREPGDEGVIYAGTSIESGAGNRLSYEGCWNFEEGNELEFGKAVQRGVFGREETIYVPIKLTDGYSLLESLHLFSEDKCIAGWYAGSEEPIKRRSVRNETQRKLIQALHRLHEIGEWDYTNTREYVSTLLDLYHGGTINLIE